MVEVTRILQPAIYSMDIIQSAMVIICNYGPPLLLLSCIQVGPIGIGVGHFYIGKLPGCQVNMPQLRIHKVTVSTFPVPAELAYQNPKYRHGAHGNLY